jgi:Reverse transcriptase (RNA-dependent DNA polymerase)
MALITFIRTFWAMQVWFIFGTSNDASTEATSSIADKASKALHNMVRKSFFWPVYHAIIQLYSPTSPFRFLLLLFWLTKSEGGRIGRRRPLPYGYPAAWMILSEVMLNPYAISCTVWDHQLRSRTIDSVPAPVGDLRTPTTGQRSTPHLGRNTSWQHSTQCTAGGSADSRVLISSGRSRDTAGNRIYIQRSLQRLNSFFTCWTPSILSARREDPICDFSLVADTSSSFSLTPYDSDLIFTLAEGQLGEVSTVEKRKMPLTKLGFAEYFITTTDGREVPIYPIVFVIPGTEQRLLSPQDYFETLNIRQTDDAYGGTNKYFWFRLNATGDVAGTHIDPVSNLPHFRVRTRKPSDPPRTFEPKMLNIQHREAPCDCHLTGNTCDCVLSPLSTPFSTVGHVYNTTTAYEETNAQLTPAQRHLLLWHHRLGHRGFHHTQRLFTACDLSTGSPFNTTDCTPCLPVPSGISKNVIASCQPPLCLSCELANAHRRGPETTTTSRIPAKDMNLQTDDLVPGACVSLDHYECPQRGRLPHTYGKEPHHQKYCGGLILADHASGYVRVFHQVSLGTSDTLLSKTAYEQHCLEAGVRIKSFHTDNGTFTSRQFKDELARCGQTITFSGTGAHHQNGVAERAIRTVTSMSRAMMLHMEQHWPDEAAQDLWPFAMDYASWLYNHTPGRESNLAPIEIFTSVKLGCQQIQRAKVFGSPAFVLDPRLQDGRKIPKWDPCSARGQFLGFSHEHSSTVALVRNVNTGSVTPQYHVVHDETFSTVTVSAEVIAHPGAWMEFFLRNRQHYLDDDDTAEFPAPTLANGPPTIHPDFAPAAPSNSAELQREIEDELEYDVEAPPESEPPPAPNPAPDKTTRSGRTIRSPRDDDFDYSAHYFMPFRGSSTYLGKRKRDSPDNHFDWDAPPADQFESAYAHFHAKAFNATIGIHNDFHPAAFAAKSQSPDTYDFWQYLRMPSEEQSPWDAAMDKEMNELYGKQTFEMVDKTAVLAAGHEIVPSTWVLRLKRAPDGTPVKHKARFCVRGDKQTLIDEDVFAPVVEWSTVRLMFTMAVTKNLKTTQIDFRNAFVQSTLPEPIFLDLPPNNRYRRSYPNKVLKVNKSLYGDKRAPKLWFNHLTTALLAMGFNQSTMDQCLFLHPDGTVFHTYVDDGIFYHADQATIDKHISDLLQRGFDIEVEQENLPGYLGVQIDTVDENTLHLTQTGLIDRIILALNLDVDSTKRYTPATATLWPPVPKASTSAHPISHCSTAMSTLTLPVCGTPSPPATPLVFAVAQALSSCSAVCPLSGPANSKLRLLPPR